MTKRRGDVGNRKATIRRIGHRDGWLCAYCRHPLYIRAKAHPHGGECGPLTCGGPKPGEVRGAVHARLEHVVPLSRGGTGADENLALACPECDAKKAGRLLSELGWTDHRRL